MVKFVKLFEGHDVMMPAVAHVTTIFEIIECYSIHQ